VFVSYFTRRGYFRGHLSEVLAGKEIGVWNDVFIGVVHEEEFLTYQETTLSIQDHFLLYTYLLYLLFYLFRFPMKFIISTPPNDLVLLQG
jgi:hypothetical protein